MTTIQRIFSQETLVPLLTARDLKPGTTITITRGGKEFFMKMVVG